jgi:glycosyltransferase involved in cell wall biosynthesis
MTMGAKKLSILIPTIYGREPFFGKLTDKLTRQLENAGITHDVEILTERDDRTMSIGTKRQILLERAQGDFVVYIDDDDDISDDYCAAIYGTIATYPAVDCIGFVQSCTFDGNTPVYASLSNRWDDWAEDKGEFKYVRTPFFPTPIKRVHALAIGYKDLRYAEDYDFSKRLKESGLIKTEHFIDKTMYYYQYVHAPKNEKYGI